MRTTTISFLGFVLLAALSGCGDDDGNEGTSMPDAGAPIDGATPDAAADAALPTPSLIVATRTGRVEGQLSEGVRTFLGIPFALPPQGERRWKAPEPAAAWEGVRLATAYGPSCAQSTPSGAAYDPTSSEDCLYLNVWAPATASAAPRPVMVWIYGGAYVFGSGGPPYNGEKLVDAGDVIVVTMNYRLGPLGYLAHPGISAEAGSAGAKANFGVLDQRLALGWVHDNIAAFGGDPSNVTVFGESAGGNSVAVHLYAEGSWPYFQRAIVESGIVMKPALTLTEAEAQGVRLATQRGCAQSDPAAALACLRALPPEQLSVRSNPWPAAGGLFYQESGRADVYMPVVDGQIVKEQIEQAFAAGRIANVPILHGMTTAEGALFHMGLFGDRAPNSMADYQASLTNRFGPAGATAVMQRYPAFATDLLTISSEAVFRCPTGRLAKYLIAHGNAQYVYLFDLTLDTPFPALQNKAFHSSEIPYVFGNSYLLGSVPAKNAAFVSTIMGYWTQFARTGDPNGHGAPTWRRWDGSNAVYQHLADPIAEKTGLSNGCELFDSLPIIAP